MPIIFTHAMNDDKPRTFIYQDPISQNDTNTAVLSQMFFML